MGAGPAERGSPQQARVPAETTVRVCRVRGCSGGAVPWSDALSRCVGSGAPWAGSHADQGQLLLLVVRGSPVAATK